MLPNSTTSRETIWAAACRVEGLYNPYDRLCLVLSPDQALVELSCFLAKNPDSKVHECHQKALRFCPANAPYLRGRSMMGGVATAAPGRLRGKVNSPGHAKATAACPRRSPAFEVGFPGEVVERLQPEEAEEPLGGAVAAHPRFGFATFDAEELSPDKLGQESPAAAPPLPFDVVGGDRLLIGDERQHLDGRLREPGLPFPPEKTVAQSSKLGPEL